MRHLRWLSVLGLLGVLGWVINPFFQVFFAFFWFLGFFWYDERRAGVLQAAGLTASVVTVFTFIGAFAYLGVLVGPGGAGAAALTPTDLNEIMGLSFAIIFGMHLLVLLGATFYFDRRGV